MVSVYQELAAQIVKAQRDATAKGAPQLIHSTIEGGAVLVRSTDGQITASVGEQYDGTYGAFTVAGPNPPQPSQPTVEQIPGGVRIRVDGTWVNALVAPMDFDHFEVYAGDPVDPEWMTWDHLRRQIGSARGGEVEIGLIRDTDFWIWVAARSKAGKLGPRSAPVGPFRAGRMLESEVDIDWDAWGGNQIFYGTVEPTTTRYGDLWLRDVTPVGDTGPRKYETYRWTPGAPDDWVLVQDQGISGALAAAVLAQQAADAKAKVFTQPTEPAWSGANGTAIWFDSDSGNLAKVWDGDSFEPRPIGNGAIQTNSLVASDVLATGTVTAALFEAIMILTNIIIAGDPSGVHVEIGPDGVVAFADDPVDGIPNEIGRFGGTVGIRNPTTGALVANIDEEGIGSFQNVNTVDPDPLFGGAPLSSKFWEIAWGAVGDAEVADPTTTGYWCTPRTDGEAGLAEFAFEAQPGRKYELSSEPFELRCATGDTAYLRIRRTTDGSTPTVTSTKLREYVVAPIRNGFSGSRQFNAVLDGPAADASPQQHRYLMTYGVGNGSTGVSAGVFSDTFRFIIRDVGPQRPNVAQYSAGSGTVTSGETPPPPPPTTAKTTRTVTYFGNWSRSWRQDGSFRTDVGSAMYQGNGDSFNGIQGGAWAWHSITGDLAGATINKIELYLFCEHSWYNEGLTAQIGAHGVLNLPTVWPGQFAGWYQTHFNKGQGKWMNITAWGNDIKSGAIRGITIYANTSDKHFYGRFTGVGPSNAPALRVTYTK